MALIPVNDLGNDVKQPLCFLLSLVLPRPTLAKLAVPGVIRLRSNLGPNIPLEFPLPPALSVCLPVCHSPRGARPLVRTLSRPRERIPPLRMLGGYRTFPHGGRFAQFRTVRRGGVDLCVSDLSGSSCLSCVGENTCVPLCVACRER